MSLDRKAVPEKQRVNRARRKQTKDQPVDTDEVRDRAINCRLDNVRRHILESIRARELSISQEPHHPVIRQCPGSERYFPGTRRVEEFVGIFLRNVRRRMVVQVGFPENHEWDRGRNECKSSLPRIRRSGISEVSVYTFVCHRSSHKVQVGPEDDVEDIVDQQRGLPEVAAQRDGYRPTRGDSVDQNSPVSGNGRITHGIHLYGDCMKECSVDGALNVTLSELSHDC